MENKLFDANDQISELKRSELMMEAYSTDSSPVNRFIPNMSLCAVEYLPLCLLRFIFKLESQVKQLEHENQARARLGSHSNTRPSGAG